eukprot:g27939.t1
MWKITQVCPVHKKQDKSSPTNYCPINLRSITSKLVEGVTKSAIKQHLLSNNLRSDAQFGFRQGHSALEFVMTLVQAWANELTSR